MRYFHKQLRDIEGVVNPYDLISAGNAIRPTDFMGIRPPEPTRKRGYRLRGRDVVIAALAYALLSAGCTNMNTFDYRKHLRKAFTLSGIVDMRPAYVGEEHVLQMLNPDKEVKSVEFTPLSKVNLEYRTDNGKLSIFPTFKEGAEKGVENVTYTLCYRDGTEETVTDQVNFAPETVGERRVRIYGVDQAAQSNLRKRIWAELGGDREGKRFNPDDPDETYTPGQHFIQLLKRYLTRKGLRHEANMDAQQSFQDVGRALSGKARYMAFDNEGILHVRELKGAFESIDYILHGLLDGISNTTEVGLQTVAINDGMASGISGTYDTLDGALQAIKDATIVGGGHMRTWQGIIRFASGKKVEFEEGQLMSETLKTNDYYLDVRYNPLRNTIETTLTVGHDILAISGLVKALEGGGGGGDGAGGYTGPDLPVFPKK